MEILEERLSSAQKALVRFQESLDRLKTSKEDSDRTFFRDSIIQRFEFTFEAFWKFLRAYLGQKMMRDISDVSNARVTFRVALEERLLGENEFDLCLRMLDDRNQTSHTYDEDFSEQLAARVEGYAAVIRTILGRIL